MSNRTFAPPAANPFSKMLSAFDPDRFYGRDNEVGSMLRGITAATPNSFAVSGIRTIGKTVTLRYLASLPGRLKEPTNPRTCEFAEYLEDDLYRDEPRRLLFVELNLDLMLGDDLFGELSSLLRAKMRETGVEEVPSAPQVSETGPQLDSVRAIQEAIHVLAQQKVRVIFLLDDCDEKIQRLLMKDRHTDDLLRSLTTRACLITSSERELTEIFREVDKQSSSLLGVLRPMPLLVLRPEAAASLVLDPMTAVSAPSVHFDDDEADFLIEVAGKQPFLLTATCEAYFDLKVDSPDVVGMIREDSARQQFEDRFVGHLMRVPEIREALRAFWNRTADPEERAILHRLSSYKTSRSTDLATSTALDRLIAKSLVEENVLQGAYSVFGRLFAAFVRDQFPLWQQGRTRGVRNFDPAEVLATLGPIDKSLFQHFLENQGTVCGFRELLAAGWNNPELPKGHLEAAVYRIRKSLELAYADSGQEYIENVRGQGYKFVAPGTQ